MTMSAVDVLSISTKRITPYVIRCANVKINPTNCFCVTTSPPKRLGLMTGIYGRNGVMLGIG
jgi:hypothetical protein